MHKIDVNKKITLVSPNVDQKFKRRLTLAWPVVSICSSKVAGLTDGIEWNGLAKETSNISWNQAIQLSKVKVSLLLRRCYSCTLTSINNFTGQSAKQRTCVGHSGVQSLLFVIEREGLDFSQ
jgi:hypothetical protein